MSSAAYASSVNIREIHTVRSSVFSADTAAEVLLVGGLIANKDSFPG